MKLIRNHISVKLMLTYFIILLVGAAVLLTAAMFTAPGAYSRHMQMTSDGMTIDGTLVPGMMMGKGPGRSGPGQGIGFDNFRAGMLDALGYAVLAAVVVAVMVSVIFSRRIVAPIRAMMGASQRIADGRFDERVVVSGTDELGQLAGQFNRMAERLEQTETMRRQLLADVSHELRTPLTAIGGYMEGLADGVLPPTSETFEQVRMEANRLSRLVDDLQELSKVEARAYRLDQHPVSIHDLITTTTKRLSRSFDEKKVKLLAPQDDSANNWMVLADEDRIIQVLTNLLGNALSYTPAGGEVSIAVEKIADEIQVLIKDTGIGIPQDSIPHIFDRFYRVDKSRSRTAGGGSGIGLTIARALVEAHGGRIWVKSEGPGKGSTFIFTLPVSAK